MATPNIVLFSPLVLSFNDLIDKIAQNLTELEIEFESLGNLEVDEEGDLSFTGEIGDYKSVDQIKAYVNKTGKVALSCIVYVVTSRLYIYIWQHEGKLCLAMEIPPTLAYHQSDDYEPGKYLLKLLVSLSTSLSVDSCVYGRDYISNLFISVSHQTLLKNLRNGSIFLMPYPNVHIISFNLITEDEIKVILDKYLTNQQYPCEYNIVAGGYHLLSVL